MMTNHNEGARDSTKHNEGARDSFNQRDAARVSDDQSERMYDDQSQRRSSRFNHSEPSSRHATRNGIKGVCFHFSAFTSTTQCRQHVDLKRILRIGAKTRLSRLVVSDRVTFR